MPFVRPDARPPPAHRAARPSRPRPPRRAADRAEPAAGARGQPAAGRRARGPRQERLRGGPCRRRPVPRRASVRIARASTSRRRRSTGRASSSSTSASTASRTGRSASSCASSRTTRTRRGCSSRPARARSSGTTTRGCASTARRSSRRPSAEWRVVLDLDPQHANAKRNIEQAERLLKGSRAAPEALKCGVRSAWRSGPRAGRCLRSGTCPVSVRRRRRVSISRH